MPTPTTLTCRSYRLWIHNATKGRFVSREEAYNIARASGQVKQMSTVKSFASEDLFP